jgi:HSP20 family protein
VSYVEDGGEGDVALSSLTAPNSDRVESEAPLMAKDGKKADETMPEFGGFLGGLGSILDKLGELAEKGKELHELKEFGGEGNSPKGVYGFTIRSNIADRGPREGGVKVEPFGNLRKDAQTGRATVHEVTEPPVDVFEEDSHILIVAEMPGIGDEDLQIELKDDILSIAAEKGAKKYRKEVLLPGTFESASMTQTCRNGVLEIKLAR